MNCKYLLSWPPSVFTASKQSVHVSVVTNDNPDVVHKAVIDATYHGQGSMPVVVPVNSSVSYFVRTTSLDGAPLASDSEVCTFVATENAAPPHATNLTKQAMGVTSESAINTVAEQASKPAPASNIPDDADLVSESRITSSALVEATAPKKGPPDKKPSGVGKRADPVGSISSPSNAERA